MSVSQALLDGLRKAIQAEVEGRSFYLMSAQATKDPQGREIFEQLAEEERRHADFLRTQYRSLETTGVIAADADLGEVPGWKAFGAIFSQDLHRRAAIAHFEVAALAVGATLEADAQKFYQEHGEAAADPAVRAFYFKLAEWESGHYHVLTAQLEALKEEYWAANEFAPF